MTPIVLWVALACGVDAGYEPAPDGHLEYIIQIEPQLLGSLGSGHDVTSEVPGGLDVRHYRLTVGTAALPRIGASAGAGRPATAATARAADGFEAQGRSDEAVGATNSQIRVGYELISATAGQYVIEIDPRMLDDLHQSDFTGDIPPGLAVSRFVISTRPGSAAVENPNRVGHTPVAAAAATVPAAAGGGPSGGDDDPSNWEPQVPTAAASRPPVSGGAPSPPTAAAIPDDPPGGDVAPPAAGAPHEEPAEMVPVAPAIPRQEHIDPPGEGFRYNGSEADASHGGGAGHADRGPAAEASPPSANVPGTLPMVPTGEPLVAMASGVDEPAEGHAHGVRKPHDQAAVADDQERDQAGVNKKGEKENPAPPETKPWLPLTVAMLALFASLGGNVFLGWVAWDSYNRSRPVVDKIERRKPSLSS